MRESFWRPMFGATIAMAMCLPARAGAGAEGKVAPIVPGFLRLKDEAKLSPAEQGEVLLGELNCLACHAAQGQQRVFTKGAPDLSHAGERLTPQYIRAYLLDSQGMKPGSTMPDLFHASPAQAKEGAVEFLTHYLVSLGGPIKGSATDANSIQADAGKPLYHRIGCVACHAPAKALAGGIPSVPFPNLAMKTTVEELTRFLLNPTAVRPGSRMPYLNLTAGEAKSIAIYLLREQIENPQTKAADLVRVPGVKLEYYEARTKSVALEKIAKLKPKNAGRVSQFTLDFPHRNNDFIAKFSGAIHISKTGKYIFRTTSDDGSRLYIDGQLIVENDSIHATGEKSGEVRLDEGDHAIVVTYFQGGGEWVLKAEWEGPGIARAEIPADVLVSIGGRPMVPLDSENFVVDPQKAQMGQMMFSIIGCAACHHMPGGPQVSRPHKMLADLDVDSPSGCLGDQIPRSTPNYYLSLDQRTALKAAIKNAKNFAQSLSAKQAAVHLSAAFNCYACHVRDDIGGPSPERGGYFTMSAEFDMGDEGRIPPRLTHVGAKLRPSALEAIILEGKLHVRPVLATRMPQFGEAAKPILAAFADADAESRPPEPAFDATVAKDGRDLFGARGMGCVNCHGVNDVRLQGTMPAPDLTNVHDRLQFNWFSDLLKDPAHVNPGTRMPAYWTNGDVAFKNLGSGTIDGQVLAMWDYLSLGASMGMPAGLNATGDELIPTDVPIVHRTFFKDAGNRSIAVGYPEMIHVVFDADVVRLAKAWKGRFFDARGMWEGRGGQHLGPLGADVIDLPHGPSFAFLTKPDAAWPSPQPTPWKNQVERNIGGKFKGYELDKQDRPIFHYVLNDVDIHEQPLPVLKASGATLNRVFQLEMPQPPASVHRIRDKGDPYSAAVEVHEHVIRPWVGLYFLAADGMQIEVKGDGQWLVDGKLTVRLNNASGMGKPTIWQSAGQRQLLIPVIAAKAAFTVEMSW